MDSNHLRCRNLNPHPQHHVEKDDNSDHNEEEETMIDDDVQLRHEEEPNVTYTYLGGKYYMSVHTQYHHQVAKHMYDAQLRFSNLYYVYFSIQLN